MWFIYIYVHILCPLQVGLCVDEQMSMESTVGGPDGASLGMSSSFSCPPKEISKARRWNVERPNASKPWLRSKMWPLDMLFGDF